MLEIFRKSVHWSFQYFRNHSVAQLNTPSAARAPRTLKSAPRNQERNWAAGVRLPGGPRTVREPDLDPQGTGDEGEMTYGRHKSQKKNLKCLVGYK